jgi:hypothetical protein
MGLGQGAGHGAGLDLAAGFPGLEDPGQRLVGRGDLLPALRQRSPGGQGLVGQRRKAGQHQGGRKASSDSCSQPG